MAEYKKKRQILNKTQQLCNENAFPLFTKTEIPWTETPEQRPLDRDSSLWTETPLWTDRHL